MVLIGVTAGKDIAGILHPLLPLAKGIIVTQANHPRALPADQLQAFAQTLGYAVESAESVNAGIQALQTYAQPNDLICVTGSLFIVGDVLRMGK